jgi:hypothetical protein
MKYSMNILHVSNLNSSLEVSYKVFAKASVILTSIVILLYAMSVTQEVTLQ